MKQWIFMDLWNGRIYCHVVNWYCLEYSLKNPINLLQRAWDLHGWIHILCRAVRLIEIEIKSRFEIAWFLNRFIARFFSAPRPNLRQYAIRTNQNAAEQNRPGIQTDSMLKKQGRWVQNRIRTWWPKNCMLHAEHTAGSSDHISFRELLSEDPARCSYLSATCKTQNAPLVIC